MHLIIFILKILKTKYIINDIMIYCNFCNILIDDEHIEQHNSDCKGYIIENINKLIETKDLFTLKHIINYIRKL
jgi:hypothetical protein